MLCLSASCLVLAKSSCPRVPFATESLPPKAEVVTDFGCFAPNFGRHGRVAGRGNFDPERSLTLLSLVVGEASTAQSQLDPKIIMSYRTLQRQLGQRRNAT